ncbi:intraflagellar transport protein 56 [Ochlerotatus camptorhynchus]|uniref:intraflagellar transport protein 56 n=1 Tax=Ochlerotatus camptorhynchus TaxID=644619 RepID=UPI0031DB81A9
MRQHYRSKISLVEVKDLSHLIRLNHRIDAADPQLQQQSGEMPVRRPVNQISADQSDYESDQSASINAIGNRINRNIRQVIQQPNPREQQNTSTYQGNQQPNQREQQSEEDTLEIPVYEGPTDSTPDLDSIETEHNLMEDQRRELSNVVRHFELTCVGKLGRTSLIEHEIVLKEGAKPRNPPMYKCSPYVQQAINDEILSRTKSESAKGSRNSAGSSSAKTAVIPTFEEFLLRRDYVGAKTVLQCSKDYDEVSELLKELWVAFCNFHIGDYKDALDQYEKIYSDDQTQKDVALNICVCMFYLGMYEEAQKLVEELPENPLKIRLLFHLAHKLSEEDRLMELHGSLRDVVEDQLSLAGMHYLRSHYQEAIDIYKRVLLDNKDLLALNVYIAICYYKLDYYDISQEVLDLYLNQHPDSTIAINLKACNRFRLFNGRAAEQEIKNIVDNGTFGADLIKHNLVVFKNGEGALQVLPQLIDIVPEARLNLAIHHLRRGEIQEAHQLMKEVQPSVPQEYILKGVVHAALGQETGSKEHLKNAQQCLHLVGGSASECDTIPGRQSMASAFFLYGQFEEVLVYLNSIRSYFVNDDVFNYNYAQAKAATGYYKEAEELLLQIHDITIKTDHTYSMVLAKCHVHSGHADQAWNIFLTKDSTPEAFALLQLIANDSYRVGEFWVAAKAFDTLEKLDPNPEYWEGKRGACAGAIQAILAKRSNGAPPGGVAEVIALLRDTTNSQAESMLRTIRRFASSIK